MKIFALMIIVILLGSSYSMANASSLKYYPTNTYIYNFNQNYPINQTIIKNSMDFWGQYGYHFKYSKTNPNFVITISDECRGDLLGTYNVTSKEIKIYADCIVHKSDYQFTQKILEHEIGHFLGFEHYSIPIMNPKISLS